MIDDKERNAGSQKRLTGGGNCSNSGQSLKKPRNINTQTFQNKYNKTFVFKKVLKLCQKNTIFKTILNRLSALRKFFDKSRSNRVSQNFPEKLKRVSSGYVLILFISALPILLYGTKWVLDNQSLFDRKVKGTEYLKNSSLGSQKLVKQCAQDAALAVAKKWNPSLTFKQQRESMLRIADEIYNNAPTYVDSTLMQAIHGIDIPRESTSKGKTYEPIKITKTTDTRLSPSLKQIGRTSTSTTMNRYYRYVSYNTWNCPFVVYHFYNMYQSLLRDYSMFTTEDDLYQNYAYYCNNSSNPLSANWYHYVTWPAVVGMWSSNGSSSNGTKSYTVRTNLSDNTVKIECENDKIKVTTDEDIGYAVPAECNVDIILTVPTNSAASNMSNYDKNTSTSGVPYIATSSTPTSSEKSTPIYQITREYQTFLKNFFYTRGVNVGVIPYSGNVSLYNNRSGWVKSPNTFVPTYFLDGTYEPKIAGSMMYGTLGSKNSALTSIGSYSGNGNIYGILCRGNTFSYYGNNITIGDLLSTTNPSSYQFRKQVYNPCYTGNANLLSMKCEQTGRYYWTNPYFILEMNPDVKFIYGMLGAFYPYYDDQNISNFIFIPVTWANNLLQSWSATGANSSVNTSSDSTNLGRLNTPSKTTAGRKKALILVVNKPDWFEPGELTYIGFDNDLSEIPMTESDCIRGDINYSDTSKKFADGSSYDGTFQGSKKILKLEKQSGDNLTRQQDSNGNYYYECGSGVHRLKFPRKGTVKLIVSPSSSGVSSEKFVAVAESSSNFAYSSDGINWKSASLPSSSSWQSVSYGNGKFVVIIYNSNVAAYSSDGINWTQTSMPCAAAWQSLCYGGGKFIAVAEGSNIAAYSSDGINWTQTSMPVSGNWKRVCYGNGKFVAIAGSSNVAGYSEDGKTWTRVTLPQSIKWKSVSYGGGKFIAVAEGSNIAVYSSDGINWTQTSMPVSGNWKSSCYGNGKFVSLVYNTTTAAWSENGSTWNTVTLPVSSSWQNVCYGNDKFVVVTEGKSIAAYSSDGINWTQSALPSSYVWKSVCYGGRPSGAIKFTGVSGDTAAHEVNYQRTYVIPSDKITSGSDGDYYIDLELTNIKLISAEITNQTCRELTHQCSLTGTTTASGSTQRTAYIDTVGLEPVTIKAKSNANSGQVSFSGISSYTMGGSSYSAGTTHTLTSPTTFTFPGGTLTSSGYSASSNFGSKTSINKIGYSLTNATITDANIAAGNQILRWDSSRKDTGLAVYATTSEQSSYNSNYYKYWTIIPMNLNNVFIKWSKGYSQDSYSYNCTGQREVSYSCTKYKDVWTTNGCSENYSCTKYGDVWTTNGCSESYSCTKYGDVWTTNGCSESYSCQKTTSYSCQESYSCCTSHTYEVNYKNFHVASGKIVWEHTNMKTTTHNRNQKLSSVTPSNYCSTFTPSAYTCGCNGVTESPCYRCGGCDTSTLSSKVFSVSYKGCAANGTCYRDATCTKTTTGTCTRKYDCYVYKSYSGTCYRYYDCYVYKSYTGTCSRKYDCYVSTPYSSTCYKTENYSTTCTGYKGSAGTMYYSALNTANARSGTDIYGYSVPRNTSSSPSSYYSSLGTGSSYGTYSGAGGKSAVFYLLNSTGAVGDKLTYFYAKNNGQAITWGGMNQSDSWVDNNQGVSANGSYIRFNGDSTVSVTVTPGDSSGYIYYNNASKNSASHSLSGSSYQTITISPATHYYEKTANGYRVTLTLKDITLDTSYGVQFVSTPEKVYKFENPSLPERSRYIDYSKNPIEFFLTSTNNSFYNHWTYDTNNGDWSNINSDGYWAVLNVESTHGDFTSMAYSDEVYEAWLLSSDGTRTDLSEYGPLDVITTSGLNRYCVGWDKRPNTVEKGGFMWTRYGNNKPGTLHLVMEAMTLPINTSLYFGANGSTQHSYQWQSDSSGNITTYDATTAVKKVTQDACAKLKSDWGSNLRVYLIKFRKQAQYKNTVTKATTNFDYSYLNNCATGTSAPYMYDITTQAELNSALSAISTNIKDWAGRTEARIVAN